MNGNAMCRSILANMFTITTSKYGNVLYIEFKLFCFFYFNLFILPLLLEKKEYLLKYNTEI